LARQVDIGPGVNKWNASLRFRPMLFEDPMRVIKETGIRVSIERIEESKEMSKEKGLAGLDEPAYLACGAKTPTL